MGKKSKNPGSHLNVYHKKMKKKSIQKSKLNQQDKKYEKHVMENPERIGHEIKKLQGQNTSQAKHRIQRLGSLMKSVADQKEEERIRQLQIKQKQDYEAKRLPKERLTQDVHISNHTEILSHHEVIKPSFIAAPPGIPARGQPTRLVETSPMVEKHSSRQLFSKTESTIVPQNIIESTTSTKSLKHGPIISSIERSLVTEHSTPSITQPLKVKTGGFIPLSIARKKREIPKQSLSTSYNDLMKDIGL